MRAAWSFSSWFALCRDVRGDDQKNDESASSSSVYASWLSVCSKQFILNLGLAAAARYVLAASLPFEEWLARRYESCTCYTMLYTCFLWRLWARVGTTKVGLRMPLRNPYTKLYDKPSDFKHLWILVVEGAHTQPPKEAPRNVQACHIYSEKGRPEFSSWTW